MKRNIIEEMHSIALRTTAEYAIENMYNITPLTNWREIHNKGIEQISDDGLILEFGVYSGDTINHIAKQLPNRTVHGFDSFKGLPENWKAGFDKGRFACKPPTVEKNVELHIGWFEDSIPKFLETHNEKIAYLHVDCDLYSSAKTIFDKLGKYIKVGTVIAFDEYFNYPGWEKGEFLAFQQFISKSKLKYQYLTYHSTSEQVLVKITG